MLDSEGRIKAQVGKRMVMGGGANHSRGWATWGIETELRGEAAQIRYTRQMPGTALDDRSFFGEYAPGRADRMTNWTQGFRACSSNQGAMFSGLTSPWATPTAKSSSSFCSDSNS